MALSSNIRNSMYNHHDMEKMRDQSRVEGYRKGMSDMCIGLLLVSMVIGFVWIYCKLTVGI